MVQNKRLKSRRGSGNIQLTLISQPDVDVSSAISPLCLQNQARLNLCVTDRTKVCAECLLSLILFQQIQKISIIPGSLFASEADRSLHHHDHCSKRFLTADASSPFSDTDSKMSVVTTSAMSHWWAKGFTQHPCWMVESCAAFGHDCDKIWTWDQKSKITQLISDLKSHCRHYETLCSTNHLKLPLCYFQRRISAVTENK